MSTWSSIVARIVAQMNTIQNIGRVHNRLRLISNESDFEAVAVVEIGGERRARAWMIDLPDEQTQWDTHDGLVGLRRMVVIDGYFQIEDADDSQSPVLALVEAVKTKLDGDIKTTKLGSTVLHGGPCQMVINRVEVFSFVVCHHVRLQLPLSTSETP